MLVSTPQPARIRLFRQERCLATAELARRVGVGRATLAKVELGYELAWPRLRRDLARELEVAEAILFPEFVR
jgi:transcriptional regulator with XRE-family HTH domain